MNLIEKLSKVEIKQDSRISDADRIFCETHQQAYDEARKDLISLLSHWQGMYEKQQELLYEVTDTYARENYIKMGNISSTEIKEKLEELPNIFLSFLISYFNRTYHVSIESDPIYKVLFPQKPDYYAEKTEKEEYKKKMQALTLSYQDILEQIFIQLGNQTFLERAIEELKQNCHESAWYTYHGSKNYELKSATITFSSGFCSTSEYSTPIRWYLESKMMPILCGLAYFETGVFNKYPYELKRFIENRYFCDPMYTFADYKTLVSIKMFKNSRVDVKFKSKTLAEQFAKDFLGLTC